MPRRYRLLIAAALVVLGGALPAVPALAQADGLSVSDETGSKVYSRRDLLADPALREITITPDPIYRRVMTYKAIPAAHLLAGLRVGPDDHVSVRAIDNFVVSIPARLLIQGDAAPAQAFVAIEPAEAPWPVIPTENQTTSAGPFYIVWRAGPASGLSSEYWAFRVAALTVVQSPARRWPGLAVGAEVAAGSAVRRGFDRFVAVCMACHRFNGDGDADLGPDLGRPMNPVDYFRPSALRRYIRDPATVRDWSDRKMPAFDKDSLGDADIDAIIAWLTYKARHSAPRRH